MKNSLVKNRQEINVIIKMERISIQIDSPSYIKISEIGKELLMFSTIINNKYSQINFEFAFCFRALYTTKGINSKVRFYKEENSWLGMDLIMPLNEFNPYKDNVSMQRRIMGKHFFPFFAENIKKYRNKLPILKPIEKDLIEDMRLFLIDNLWLLDENGELKLSVIKTVPYERVMSLFGNPKQKKILNIENGQKMQSLLWEIDKETKLLIQYKLINKNWILQNYKIE
jgi:hypothetical protein